MATWESFQKYLFEKLSYGRKKTYTVPSECSDEYEYPSDYSLQDLSQPIFSIPEEVLLNIFSFLPASDLVTCSKVCRLWYRVSSDRILWKHTLDIESKKWQTVTSGTYWPDADDDDNSDEPLHPKITYLRCTHVTQPIAPAYMLNMAQMWRSLFSRKKAKIMMVGPGLDSHRTRKVVHKMVHDKCVEFEPVGMNPGVNGFGTGLTFKLNINEEFHQFDLITLYSHRVQGRGECVDQNQRIRTSFLFNPIPEDESLSQLEANEQVRTLCTTIDGLIFVIDAEEAVEGFEHIRYELRTFLSAFPTCEKPPKPVPILVLSLIKSGECKRNVSALQVAQNLRLFNLPNQWYIQDSIVKDMSGISRGILWIVQKWLST